MVFHLTPWWPWRQVLRAVLLVLPETAFLSLAVGRVLPLGSRI